MPSAFDQISRHDPNVDSDRDDDGRKRNSEIPNGWAYIPSSWEQIEMILAPELSARERLALDTLMHKEIDEIQDRLGFFFG